jgi:preprotein translocase subunit SecY
MLQSVLRALQLPDLRRRILFTLAMLLIFRLIAHIPVPNVDPAALASLQQALKDNQLAALLNIFAGGALQNLSVAAMGVYPYITAQIILQLLIPIIPALQRRMQEDQREGRRWMEKWTYYLAVPMAVLSAIGQINIFNSLSIQALGRPIIEFAFAGDLLLPSPCPCPAGVGEFEWFGLTKRKSAFLWKSCFGPPIWQPERTSARIPS